MDVPFLFYRSVAGLLLENYADNMAQVDPLTEAAVNNFNDKRTIWNAHILFDDNGKVFYILEYKEPEELKIPFIPYHLFSQLNPDYVRIRFIFFSHVDRVAIIDGDFTPIEVTEDFMLKTFLPLVVSRLTQNGALIIKYLGDKKDYFLSAISQNCNRTSLHLNYLGPSCKQFLGRNIHKFFALKLRGEWPEKIKGPFVDMLGKSYILRSISFNCRDLSSLQMDATFLNALLQFWSLRHSWAKLSISIPHSLSHRDFMNALKLLGRSYIIQFCSELVLITSSSGTQLQIEGDLPEKCKKGPKTLQMLSITRVKGFDFGDRVDSWSEYSSTSTPKSRSCVIL
ncbi:hypothetical protein L596_021350 [Steinernema carpocapsae]|uniref:Uncharacterized protein n=1 Tax=Steinernema carpocapsae TaxID=34508 RepID=A0A4U5MIJ3_STECR|nr:hypothetical protein L596_021350 [Steinernema carpocapsae]